MRLAWWNTQLRPPRSVEPGELRVAEALVTLKQLIARGCSFIGLGEVSPMALGSLQAALRSGGLDSWNAVATDDRGLGVLFDAREGRVRADRTLTVQTGLARAHAGWVVQYELEPVGELRVVLLHWRTDAFGGAALREGCGELIRQFESGSAERPMVVLGDFNCEPFDRSVVRQLSATRDAQLVRQGRVRFFNPFWSAQPSGPDGLPWATIRLTRPDLEQQTLWKMVDFGLVNRPVLAGSIVSGEVVDVAEMTSDHLPVILTLDELH